MLNKCLHKFQADRNKSYIHRNRSVSLMMKICGFSFNCFAE